MTAMPGGAADKAGNYYEHLWTVLRLLDLLSGKASRMLLEPPGLGGVGIEFEIDEGDVTWGEQAKGGLSGSSWTIARLGREGVLANALQQIQNGRSFRLVAAKDATRLATLAARSHGPASVEIFGRP